MNTLPLPIAADHPAYAGHFPGQPILPGVVLLDTAQRVLQAAGIGPISGVAQAKFLSPVLPGEALALDFEVGANGVRFEIRCDTRRIASGRFALRAPAPSI